MRLLWQISIAAALSYSSPAFADVYVLSNDSVEDGDEVAFQEGFVTGEAAAATLGPVSDSFAVRKVQFLFGPAGPPLTVTVSVYADNGVAGPGALLYAGDYEITPANDALHEIDLTNQNVEHVGAGEIRVAIGLKHDGPPGVARDEDGCTKERNWIDVARPGGWMESCAAGLTGDWVIRAEIDGPPQGTGGAGGNGGGNGNGGDGQGGAPSPSAGGAGAGGNSSGGGASNGGSAADDASEDGCGCRVVDVSRPSGALISALGMLALAWRRRRPGSLERAGNDSRLSAASSWARR